MRYGFVSAARTGGRKHGMNLAKYMRCSVIDYGEAGQYILSACEKRYGLLVYTPIFFDVVKWGTIFGTLEGWDGGSGWGQR
jgi:hypothetical protein